MREHRRRRRAIKAKYACDLHGHTNRSDGNDTPAEFIRHAADRGVKIAAITDHDVVPPSFVTVDGKEQEILSYARQCGVQLIKGIEISCETWIDDTHLVCFSCDWDDPFFADLDAFTIRSKVHSYQKLVKALNASGMPMTWAEVLNNNGHPVEEAQVQKKMIFELMARKGYTESWQAAKLFVKSSPKIVIKREKPDAVTVIREIHRMGGIVILAHPHLITEPVHYRGREITREAFIERLIQAGLDGIEASYTYDKTSYNGNQTPDEIQKEIEDRYGWRGLIISGGSDYHADSKKGVKNPREIGDCGLTEEAFWRQKKLSALLK